MKSIYMVILSFIFIFSLAFAQEENEFKDTYDEVEVYLIDNYVKNDKGKIFIVSWMTNIPVKSKIKIQNVGEFVVSDTLTDFHSAKIDLSNYNFSTEENFFIIISELEDGTKITSDEYSFIVPLEKIITQDSKETKRSSSYYLYNFLLGTALWLMPSPGLVIEENQTKPAIIKDLPIVSIGSASAYKTFPYVYLYVGYGHIFDSNFKNSFRFGTKYLYEIKNLRHFVSFGIGGLTNFKGKNGYYGDFGFSFLKILSTFEMYASYSYNFLPSSKNKFHLFTIGLFTSSFSINLNY